MGIPLSGPSALGVTFLCWKLTLRLLKDIAKEGERDSRVEVKDVVYDGGMALDWRLIRRPSVASGLLVLLLLQLASQEAPFCSPLLDDI